VRLLIDATKSDIFDVLAYIAFALAPITREVRVASRKGLIFARYQGKQQEFLDFVLDHYIAQGVGELDREKPPHLLELRYHSVNDAVKALGDVKSIAEVFVGFQEYLYTGDSVA